MKITNKIKKLDRQVICGTPTMKANDHLRRTFDENQQKQTRGNKGKQ